MLCVFPPFPSSFTLALVSGHHLMHHETCQQPQAFRGTQGIVSVEYLFGRPVIALNFRLLGKCHFDKNDVLGTKIGQLGFSESQ